MPAGAANIELLCLDVDGVMTDGSILIDDHGVETKRFHVRDGTGIRLWLKLGYQLAIFSGRSGTAVRHRANELGVQHVMLGLPHKLQPMRDLLGDLNLEAGQAAVLGDDLPDLPLLRLCGYPMAVADAAAEVKAAARFTTAAPGGRGAVREAIEHLLKAKERWPAALTLLE